MKGVSELIPPRAERQEGPRQWSLVTFLIAATFRSPGEEDITRVRVALDELTVRDWQSLMHLADDHGVLPLLRKALTEHACDQLPGQVMDEVHAIHHTRLRQGLHLTGVLPRLLDMLEQHNVDALPFKGPVLAAMAYGGIAHRPFTDLDLLVRPEDVQTVVEALQAVGFEEKNPLPSSFETHWETYRPWDYLHGNANGYVRGKGTSEAVHVDIHWGLTSRYFQVPLDPDPLWDRCVFCTLDTGVSVRTFEPEDTMLILCLHGVKHDMDRLKYICDVAAIQSTHPTLDWGIVLSRARSAGVERMVLLNAHLTTRLFDLPMPEPVAVRLAGHQNRQITALGDNVCTRIQKAGSELISLYRRCWFHLNVRDRHRDGLGAMYHQLQLAARPTPEDLNWVQLPNALQGLYWIARPIRRLWQALSRNG